MGLEVTVPAAMVTTQIAMGRLAMVPVAMVMDTVQEAMARMATGLAERGLKNW